MRDQKYKFNSKSFEMFVAAVLRQIAAKEGRNIRFNFNPPQSFYNNERTQKIQFDAVAPQGLLYFKTPVFFECKYLKTKYPNEANMYRPGIFMQ